MKKILLGLFILGTLGMAQSNYEVYVKSGVKISQSEVDRDSKEIENIVNKIIRDYETRDKKIMLEKSRIMFLRNMKNQYHNNNNYYIKDIEFFDKMSEVMANEMITSLSKSKYVPKSISFTGKNIAKVEITEISPDFDSDSDTNFNSILEKAGVTDEQMKNLEHISDLSDQKKDKFFKYLSEEIKKDLNKTIEESRILEFRKVNGKWQTKDELYEIPKI